MILGFRESSDRGKAFTDATTVAAASRRTLVPARTDGTDSTAIRLCVGKRSSPIQNGQEIGEYRKESTPPPLSGGSNDGG